MALPTVFESFDPESIHFGVRAPQGATLRACLGHLNRVTRSTYPGHLENLKTTLHKGASSTTASPEGTGNRLDAFAQLLLGKVATEPHFGALYASLLVDVSTGLCGNGTPPAVTGPTLVDRVLTLLVPFVNAPIETLTDPEELRLRFRKTACLAFLGQLLRKDVVQPQCVLDIHSMLLNDVRYLRPSPTADPPTPPPSVGFLHALQLLCKLLIHCGFRLAVTDAATVAETLALLRELTCCEDPRRPPLGLHAQFLVLDTLELAANGWRKPVTPALIWNVDLDAGPAVAG
eukprot:TRINITY_DN2735_c0_g1_i1.p1 TRINITY_DN2735_c0_g1~~TRINITY_DN2735_c0_g1_i1.p1  ORF type:complete len:297 (-),score=52.22 TRINITY_DN2735_c0_g1_i1:236-1102(-)